MKITIDGSCLSVVSPYNANFVAAAKQLGGRWSAPAWKFDIRDEQRVRDLCRTVYGSDGLTTDTVTLRIEWTKAGVARTDPITVNGRPIARAFGRDSGAKLAEGVVVLAGGFGSGGSHKNWETTVQGGTVVLVRDFPRAAAAELVAQTQAGESKRQYSIEPETAPIDREALSAERAQLAARIAEIDGLLA